MSDSHDRMCNGTSSDAILNGERGSMTREIDLAKYDIAVGAIHRNAAPALLYELAVSREGALIASSGALATRSGEKTGRSPKDKRVVFEPQTAADVWWGNVNIKLEPQSFAMVRQRAIEYLNRRPYLYVVDGYAGRDPRHRLKVRIVCGLAYHALFMRNMLIRPTRDELATFGEPDFVVFNAGPCRADTSVPGVTSPTCVALSFARGEMVILGTLYAGEMKKGVFTLMNYRAPKNGVLSMHCSANEGADGDVTLFFGLSGTGKTTLSADPRRRLIGDDEHCWSDDGTFNIEGGCYAKCIGLSIEKEPQIMGAIRFGAVLENVVMDAATREVDYSDASITENTRSCYPIEFIPDAKTSGAGGHPRNIIFLACDAFGVLPPISRLTPAQASYHFLSGYTAKVAGTEAGVREPEATFSACFGAPFLVLQPRQYADMLADRIRIHGARVWQINTGWMGGSYGTGSRIALAHTRALIDAIHGDGLMEAEFETDPVFGFQVPTSCPGVPSEMLRPRQLWSDSAAYDAAASKLAKLFQDNFAKYAAQASGEIKSAGPCCS